MTRVRLSHQPDQVVDLSDAEIADLRNLGMGVQEESAPADLEAATADGASSGNKRK